MTPDYLVNIKLQLLSADRYKNVSLASYDFHLQCCVK